MKLYLSIMLLFTVMILVRTVDNYPHMQKTKRFKKASSTDTSEGVPCGSCGGDKQPNKMPQLNLQSAKSRATGIAVKAAQEAKKASDDMTGAVQAATRLIKCEYAEKAASAAKAAEAALFAKQQIVEQMIIEVHEAELVVEEETQALTSAESNTQLASMAFCQAKTELKLLQQALRVAQENFASSEQVSAISKQSLNDKIMLLEAAKNRVELLARQVAEARSDLIKTKQAAYKAACAANEARQRIDRNRRGATE